MRFKKVTFNPLSIMVGVHYGRNPATGDRFLHMAFCPFVGFDFWWPEVHGRAQAAAAPADDLWRTTRARGVP
jgi:hypothetical protein